MLRQSPKVELLLYPAASSSATGSGIDNNSNNISKNDTDTDLILWECEFCSSLELPTTTKCSSCGMVTESAVPVAVFNEQKEWDCQMCTFKNCASSNVCEMCEHSHTNDASNNMNVNDVNNINNINSNSNNNKEECFKFSFRSSGSDLFNSTLQNILKNYRQKQISTLTSTTTTLTTTSAKPIVGIDGLFRRAEQEKRERQVDESSFKDLENLMIEAERLLKIATNLRAKIGRQQCSTEEDSFSAFLMDLGVPSSDDSLGFGGGGGGLVPTSSKQQQQEQQQQKHGFLATLQRDLLRFSLKILRERRETILMLADLFSLFNRARAHDLISPKDMMDALEGVGGGVGDDHHRHHRHYDDELLVLKFIGGLKFLERKGAGELEFFFPKTPEQQPEADFVDAIQLSRRHNLSIKVALMKLKEGVDGGLLVKDGVEKYWKNLFIQ